MLEPSKGSPPPRIPATKQNIQLFFVFPENYQSYDFPLDHLSLLNPFLTDYLPFKAVPLIAFMSPFPHSIGTSFSLKPTLLSLLEILLLQSSLFGESGPLKSSFLAAPGGSRCFYGRTPANAEAAGHHMSPGSHVRSLGWHPLSPLPL